MENLFQRKPRLRLDQVVRIESRHEIKSFLRAGDTDLRRKMMNILHVRTALHATNRLRKKVEVASISLSWWWQERGPGIDSGDFRCPGGQDPWGGTVCPHRYAAAISSFGIRTAL